MFSSIKIFIKTEYGIAILLSSFILALTLIGQSWNDFVLVADQTIQSIPSSASWRNTQLASAEGTDLLTQGLVGWWKFDEGSGTTAGDASGGGNVGMFVNEPAWVSITKAKVGNGAVQFNGINNYISVGTLDSFGASNGQTQMQQGVTISLWLKTTNNSSIMTLVGNRSLGLSPGFGVSLNSGFYGMVPGSIRVSWSQSSNYGSSFAFNANRLINDGNWHLLTVVIKMPGTQQIWIDGTSRNVSIERDSFSTYQTWSITPSLGIGADIMSATTENYFLGLIDDVRVYNRVLSADEISQLYALGDSTVAPANTSSPSSPLSVTTVAAAPTTYTLTVSKSGSGTGAVTGGSIFCGSTCSQSSITSGTSITLSATPTSGSTFTGWSGGGCSGTDVCLVTLNADTSIRATFSTASTQIPAGADVYVAANGNDSTCARNNVTKPCLTLSRAYTVSQAGDVIEISGGTYPDQTIPKLSKGTAIVTFEPASGASVILGSVNIYASYVELRNMASSGRIGINPVATDYPSGTNHITLRNMNAESLGIVAEDVLVKGGNFGGFDACDASKPEDIVQIWETSRSGNWYASSRVTIDGAVIHDVTDHNNACSDVPPPAQGRHVDCMQILSGHFITVRNSVFYNCATSDIIARPFRVGLDNLLIENNFMQAVMNPGLALNLGDGSDVFGGTNIVRYNTIFGAAGRCSTPGCLQFYGNIINAGYCPTNVNAVFDHNVFISGLSNLSSAYLCGTNFKQGNPSFVGPTPSSSYLNGIIPNYHLAANDVVALDSGDPTRYPATDIDGQTRFFGLTPDAGADEYTGSGGVTLTNGLCSTTLNQCTTGTFSDLADTSANYLWSCMGSNGGTTASCSLPITPVTPPTPTTGDFNADGIVNSIDLSLMITAWNTSNATYDLNRDGRVNSLDYVIMVRNWSM